MAAIEGARFGHVNVTTDDWRALAAFYREVFGMEQVGPERDIRSEAFDGATGLHGAHLTGVHLRLPGGSDDGPTLEVYEYDRLQVAAAPAVDRPGWGHIAFQVPDVAAARTAVLAAGGGAFGEIITTATADGRHVTWCYATDPAGNIVELQAWDRSPGD